jgi:hypothetical protein
VIRLNQRGLIKSGHWGEDSAIFLAGLMTLVLRRRDSFEDQEKAKNNAYVQDIFRKAVKVARNR